MWKWIAFGVITIHPSHTSHNALDKYPAMHHNFSNRNVHTRAHFCCKTVHCGLWDWFVLSYLTLSWVMRTDNAFTSFYDETESYRNKFSANGMMCLSRHGMNTLSLVLNPPVTMLCNTVRWWFLVVSSDKPLNLTHWPLGDMDAVLKLQFSISFYWLMSSHRLRILPWDECQGNSPMISQHWFR